MSTGRRPPFQACAAICQNRCPRYAKRASIVVKKQLQSPAGLPDPLVKHWHQAVANDRLAHLVKDATRSFLRSMQARLHQHDVSLGHWTFLRVLWERDGITQRELSNVAGVMEPTTMAALRTMEEFGYVTRKRLDGNKKNSYVFLTLHGKRLKRLLVPLAEDVNNLAVSGIPEEDVAACRRCLLAIIYNLAADARSE